MKIASANDCAWNVAEGKRNGLVSLIRYRPDLKEHLGHADYARRLVIMWDYETNSSGMPSTNQLDEMRLFEDLIVEALDPDKSGILVLILTNAGVREWHFYIRDVNDVGNKINHALTSYPDLPISMQVEDDAEWGELQRVYSLVD